MANEWRGEVALNIGGKDRVLRISQNDVADLEDELGGSIIAIMRKGDVGVRFVRAVIAQGLKEQVTLSAKQALFTLTAASVSSSASVCAASSSPTS